MNANEKRKFAIKYAQYERLLVLQGYAEATIDNYCRSIRRLADWAERCPDKRLKKHDFETYFSARIHSHSWSAVKVDRNAFMRYWELVLDREWEYIHLIKPPIVKHLPNILNAEEMSTTLSCVHKTHYEDYNSYTNERHALVQQDRLLAVNLPILIRYIFVARSDSAQLFCMKTAYHQD